MYYSDSGTWTALETMFCCSVAYDTVVFLIVTVVATLAVCLLRISCLAMYGES
jgi:hypothetical protein